jgi:hypothetical protein
MEHHSRSPRPAIALVLAILVGSFCLSQVAAGEQPDAVVATRLAQFLRAARTVISQYQGLINDPSKGDKGLTGDRVVAETSALYMKQTGEDPAAVDPASLEGKLLRAQIAAVRHVMDDNQSMINAPNVGFKGFIPAIFARLVNEKFRDNAQGLALIKVTAPEALVRNRTSRPDAWEMTVLLERFGRPDWPRGQAYSEHTSVDGRPAFRLIQPEYYAASCLSCHGTPKGETDITGYPKEGGKEGDLGAAISVTLFQ